MINIFCVWVGNKFSIEDVKSLHKQVKENLSIEHNFICLTDRPNLHKIEGIIFEQALVAVPDAWCKLSVFGPKTLGSYEGVACYLDLDVIINGSLDDLFKKSEDKLQLVDGYGTSAMIWDLKPTIINVSKKEAKKGITTISQSLWMKIYTKFKVSDMRRLNGLGKFIEEVLEDSEIKIFNRLHVKKHDEKVKPSNLTKILYGV